MTRQHKEAFALMWYACPCGHRERIWNSRDGVTPFGGIPCPSCGGKGPERRGLSHVDWNLDECSPDHKLADGQRFFRSGTPDEAEAIMRRRIEKTRGTKWEPNAETAVELIRHARESKDGEFQPGWPMVDRFAVPQS